MVTPVISELGKLRQKWDAHWPDHTEIREDLLTRWSEDHRDYHGLWHLAHGLEVLPDLGTDDETTLAYWFHDAVHHMETPSDEQRSAALARELLTPAFGQETAEEVARLVLTTINHQPNADDHRAVALCDADLSALGLPWPEYQRAVQGLRTEVPQFDDMTWQAGRIAFLQGRLARDHFFTSKVAKDMWEDQARENLQTELHHLLTPRT